jgi:hypothetical protein
MNTQYMAKSMNGTITLSDGDISITGGSIYVVQICLDSMKILAC